MPATVVSSISRSVSFTRSICSACILRPAAHGPKRVNKLRTKSVRDWRRYSVTKTSHLRLNSSSNLRCLPSLALRQTSVVPVTARRRSFDDDYVEIDDEDRWGNQARQILLSNPEAVGDKPS